MPYEDRAWSPFLFHATFCYGSWPCRCTTTLGSAELSPGQFGLFLITGDSCSVTCSGSLSVETCHYNYNYNCVLFMPLQLLQAISLTFSRRVFKKVSGLRIIIFFFNIKPVFTFALLHLHLYSLIQFLYLLGIYTLVDG